MGPRYGIDADPPALLASAYRSTYQLALDNHCESLAVPAISCGVYGYPLEEAAEIAVRASSAQEFSALQIAFYLFGDDIFNVFSTALKRSGA